MQARALVSPPISTGQPSSALAGRTAQPQAGRPVIDPQEIHILSCCRRALEAHPTRFGLPDGWKCPDHRGIWTELQIVVAGLTPAAGQELWDLAEFLTGYYPPPRSAAGGSKE